MKIIRAALAFVTISSTAAREKTPNARLRGALSAVGVLLESDSSGAAGGEEGRFDETDTSNCFQSATIGCNGCECTEDSECCMANNFCLQGHYETVKRCYYSPPGE